MKCKEVERKVIIEIAGRGSTWAAQSIKHQFRSPSQGSLKRPGRENAKNPHHGNRVSLFIRPYVPVHMFPETYSFTSSARFLELSFRCFLSTNLLFYEEDTETQRGDAHFP